MSRSKLLIITVIIIVCVVVASIIYNSVFKEELIIDKTYKEIYEELSEEEKNRFKEKYKELQNSDSLKEKMEWGTSVPDAIKEKMYPDIFTRPFRDFLNSK